MSPLAPSSPCQAPSAPVPDYANVAGNHYDKYTARNPVARWLLRGFLGALHDLAGSTGASSVLEVGCGEGYLSIGLAGRGYAVQGFDVDPGIVATANAAAHAAGLDRPFRVASVYDLAPGDAGIDLVVCCEVLEHLPDPALALERIAALGAPWAIFSVPREPLWRALNVARGKYVRQLGNTPGHIQHWSATAFTDLVAERFRIVEIRRPLPWTMLLCKTRT